MIVDDGMRNTLDARRFPPGNLIDLASLSLAAAASDTGYLIVTPLVRIEERARRNDHPAAGRVGAACRFDDDLVEVRQLPAGRRRSTAAARDGWRRAVRNPAISRGPALAAALAAGRLNCAPRPCWQCWPSAAGSG